MHRLLHIPRGHKPSTAPRIVSFVAVAVLVSLTGRSLFAEEQAAKPPKPVSPSAELAQKMLALQIKSTEESLRRLTEQAARTNDPAALEAQKAVERIFELENRVLKLSQGEQTESTKAEIEKIANEMVQAAADLQLKSLREKRQDSAAENQQLQQVKDQLSEREKQLTKARQLVEQQRRPSLPPLENGTMKIYKLSFVPARDAAQTVESLFGAQALRLAVDERGNTLIAYSKPESITALDALMARLDEEAATAKGKQNAASLPRSLMLRVFWLADSVPESVGQNPGDFLPHSVLNAVNKLGLVAPRLVIQTSTSLATNKDNPVDFSSTVPAVLIPAAAGDQPIEMNCHGKLKLVSDNNVRLDMGVQVLGNTTNCDLQGSMTTPLGHYMVLGTANSRFVEGGSVGAGRPGAFGRMGMAGGPAGPGGAFVPGGPEGGPGMAPGAAPVDPNAAAPGAQGQSAKPSYTMSRFAFVVQVVEGESYAAERPKGK